MIAVDVCGICVIHPLVAGGELEGHPFESLPIGTSLAFRVRSQDLLVLGVNMRDSRISRVTDDTGRDLIVQDPEHSGYPYNMWLSPFGSVPDEAPREMVVQYSVRSTPSVTATRLQCTGTLVLPTAEGTEERAFPNIPLQVAPLVDANGEAEIVHIGAPTIVGSGRPFAIKFRFSGALAVGYRDALLVDADGTPIGDSALSGNPPVGAREIEFTLDEAPLPPTLQLRLWSGLAEVSVPVDTTIGIGIQDPPP